MKKYFAIFAVVLLALVGCNNKNNGTSNASDIDGQWHIIEWNNETPEFDAYIEFKAGKFNIYQQVYSIFFEKFEGSYNVSGDIITGSYTNGSNWACGYKFEVSGDQLTLYSQEDISVTSVYEKCEIPQAVIDEATTTRSAEAVPFL
jgi:hypothetical protein